jgi:2-polyprenyl-3-methyl-5-hydroxy-6-metoxy-1,4-benzoquinol methylase
MEIIRREISAVFPGPVERVLDVGCSLGDTGLWLKEQKLAAYVAGVDVDEKAIESARRKLDSAVLCNVEEAELPFEKESFDLILCLDVLEHLRDPWVGLRRIREYLKPGGVLVTSIPNVRNFRVTLPLLFLGRFEYQESGLLDRTHLRFFTYRTAVRLVRDAGFTIERVDTTGARRGSLTSLLNLATLGLAKHLFVIQYLIRARRSG